MSWSNLERDRTDAATGFGAVLTWFALMAGSWSARWSTRQTATNHWLVVDIDLTTFAGKGVNVECRLLGGHLALLS